MNITKADLDFSNEYNLKITRDDKVHGLVAWFDVEFKNMKYPSFISTSPHKKPTHWKQVVFYTDKDFYVRKGDELYGSIAIRKSQTNFRDLDVKISYKKGRDVDFVNLYKFK